jgi:hypothetical protein
LCHARGDEWENDRKSPNVRHSAAACDAPKAVA